MTSSLLFVRYKMVALLMRCFHIKTNLFKILNKIKNTNVENKPIIRRTLNYLNLSSLKIYTTKLVKSVVIKKKYIQLMTRIVNV